MKPNVEGMLSENQILVEECEKRGLISSGDSLELLDKLLVYHGLDNILWLQEIKE